MNVLGFLLYPISLIYGLIINIRNLLFDLNIIKGKEYSIPIICVGNLSMGGTGKTPHVEYIIKILKKEGFKLAALSRGYSRKTKGFAYASEKSKALDIGDEPLQYFKKFNEIKVAVDEKRRRGIENILKENQEIQVILLDDAFQHRYVKAGLSILLTDYYNLFYHDFVIPSGRLREQRINAKRADIIIVSKCPKVLSPLSQKFITESIRKYSNKQLFFSYIDYGELVSLNAFPILTNLSNYTMLLFSGIANPYPLEDYLSSKCSKLEVIRFRDHYQFKKDDILTIVNEFKNIPSKNKLIITTEKDAMRIKDTELMNFFVDLPLFYIPIEIKFHCKTSDEFDNQIINYVKRNQSNSIVS